MIITESILGVLLPASSIFIQAHGAKDLIENTNESRARLREFVRSGHSVLVVIVGDIRYSNVHVCGSVCVSVINPR